jgi:hypothetical protein
MGSQMFRTFRRFVAAFVFVSLPLIPSIASAQEAPPPAQPPGGPRGCAITGPTEAICSATLCGPPGSTTYVWQAKVKGGFPTQFTQCITATESGTYSLTWIDPKTGTKLQCSQTVFIEKCTQNRPPDCSGARAKDPVLWPPDHKLSPVEIEGVVDPDGDPIAITAYAITQDEALDANGDGETCADGDIQDGQAYVRSERTGDPENPGNGRVYVISFVAVDSRGGRCSGQVTVCVPHDMGMGDTCVDDGQLFDSLGDCPQ